MYPPRARGADRFNDIIYFREDKVLVKIDE